MRYPLRSTLLSAIAVLSLYAAASLPAQAQLGFTLLAPDITAGLGDTVTFRALLTNSAGVPLYLNNDFGLVDNPLLLDDLPFQTQFLLPTPQPTLLADGLPHAYVLFTISLPAYPTLYVGLPTTFNGSFTLFGGPTDADQNTLGRQEFSVRLGPAAPSVPEPGTLALLTGLSLCGAGFARRARR